MALAFYDYEKKTSWSYRGDTFFHAASTIKVPILIGVFMLIDEGIIHLDSRVHVRNRFLSLVDNEPYRLQSSRDGCHELYTSVGKTLPVLELAYHMIIKSSNLATNLLIDLVGVSALQEKLAHLGVKGIDLKRGVEDELAFEHDINNRVTANGLLDLFLYLYDTNGFSPELSEKMMRILLDQKFNQGIPAGLPKDIRTHAKIAHKTGEISTVAHDAGLIFLEDRKPYALTILTERIPGKSNSRKAIQRLSRLIYNNFIK